MRARIRKQSSILRNIYISHGQGRLLEDVPVGQDDLDVQISGQSSLTLLGLGSQSDDVCDLFRDRSSIQSPHSKDVANDSVLIPFWQVRTADDHA